MRPATASLFQPEDGLPELALNRFCAASGVPTDAEEKGPGAGSAGGSAVIGCEKADGRGGGAARPAAPDPPEAFAAAAGTASLSSSA